MDYYELHIASMEKVKELQAQLEKFRIALTQIENLMINDNKGLLGEELATYVSASAICIANIALTPKEV